MSARKLNIAIVVGRYGTEAAGGAEFLTRLAAEHLQDEFNITVITTKAKDYVTWRDEYTADEEVINGIKVHRFSVDFTRDIEAFGRKTEAIFTPETTLEDQEEWMRMQGPYSTGVFNFIKEHEHEFDVFIFTGYLFAITYFGYPLVKHKALLIPTAHDEPFIFLKLFKQLFQDVKGMFVNTPEELDLIRHVFKNNHVPAVITAVGLEQIKAVDIDAQQVRQKYHLDKPYMLYIGRIEGGKGLDDVFTMYKKLREETTLDMDFVLIGKAIMPIPEHEGIKFLGFVSPEEKYALIQQAEFILNPSFYESLSLIIMEAWQMGKAVLVNGRCDVLKGQVTRAQGGLFYTKYEEFERMVAWLLDHPKERKLMGENGKQYVQANYDWGVVKQKFISFINTVVAAWKQ